MTEGLLEVLKERVETLQTQVRENKAEIEVLKTDYTAMILAEKDLEHSLHDTRGSLKRFEEYFKKSKEELVKNMQPATANNEASSPYMKDVLIAVVSSVTTLLTLIFTNLIDLIKGFLTGHS